MTTPLSEPPGERNDAAEVAAEVVTMRAQIERAVLGQSDVVTQVLAALLAGGHVLLEGVPGLGKTLLVLALARTFKGAFARIQFTPDLMPSDVSGHAINNTAICPSSTPTLNARSDVSR